MTMPPNDPPSDSDLDTKVLGEEAIASGAEVGAARLGGVDGTGTLQVVRGQNGEIMEIKGTWRSNDGDASDDGMLDQLCRAVEAGETVRYQGPLVDPQGNEDRVSVDVEFTSSSRYAYVEDVEDDEHAPERRIFNFRPVEGAAALNR